MSKRHLTVVASLFLLILFLPPPSFAATSSVHSVSVVERSQFELELEQPELSLRLGGVFDTVAIKGLVLQMVDAKGDTIEASSDYLGYVRFNSFSTGVVRLFVNDDELEISSVIANEQSDQQAQYNLYLQKKISVLWIVLTVLGGLGIFLWGMESMSNGLQTVAGASLRKLVAALTRNRLMALMIGTGVTSIVQSSSITTVMVVGFVNSGMMHLREALGVIMGANIGTTITAWILVLAVDQWGLPILGGAIFLHIFSKREKVKFAALALMGIGMVFFGLDLMKSGLSILRESPQFIRAFTLFQADSLGEVAKAALLGCVLTMVVQSSSATMGIVIALTSQGVIGFHTSAALVLGANVGTTVTAQLAVLGANVEARRCAMFHTLFNLTGTILAVLLFPYFIQAVFGILALFWQIEFVEQNGVKTLSSLAAPTGIAVFGTLFNALVTLIYFPILNHIATFLEKLFPERPLQHMGKRVLAQGAIDSRRYDVPMTALAISRHDVVKMGERTVEMMQHLERFLDQDESDYHREEIFKAEAELDVAMQMISSKVTDLLSEPLAESSIAEVKAQLRMSDEQESVSDYIAHILKLYLRLQTTGVELNLQQQNELQILHTKVNSLLIDAATLQEKGDAVAYLPTMEVKTREITMLVRSLRDAHWKRLSEEKLNPVISTVYGDLLTAYRKIKNHLMNVIQARAGVK